MFKSILLTMFSMLIASPYILLCLLGTNILAVFLVASIYLLFGNCNPIVTYAIFLTANLIPIYALFKQLYTQSKD